MNGRQRLNGQARRLLRIVLLGFGAACVLVGGISGTAAAAPVVPPWRMGLPWTSRTATVTVGEVVLEAEVADTGALRERGLGYRDALAPGTGMLFVYAEPGERSFWMKGMRFCLDIIWIEGGQIVGAAQGVCPVEGAADQDLPRYRSPEPVRYVLEVPAGWMIEHGFREGTPVRIDLPGSE
jgi:uncharacterized membrane protein (UPF0127 family)